MFICVPADILDTSRYALATMLLFCYPTKPKAPLLQFYCITIYNTLPFWSTIQIVCKCNRHRSGCLCCSPFPIAVVCSMAWCGCWEGAGTQHQPETGLEEWSNQAIQSTHIVNDCRSGQRLPARHAPSRRRALLTAHIVSHPARLYRLCLHCARARVRTSDGGCVCVCFFFDK